MLLLQSSYVAFTKFICCFYKVHMLLLQSYKKKCTAQKSSASFLSYIRQAISKFNGNKFVSGLY